MGIINLVLIFLATTPHPHWYFGTLGNESRESTFSKQPNLCSLMHSIYKGDLGLKNTLQVPHPINV